MLKQVTNFPHLSKEELRDLGPFSVIICDNSHPLIDIYNRMAAETYLKKYGSPEYKGKVETFEDEHDKDPSTRYVLIIDQNGGFVAGTRITFSFPVNVEGKIEYTISFAEYFKVPKSLITKHSMLINRYVVDKQKLKQHSLPTIRAWRAIFSAILEEFGPLADGTPREYFGVVNTFADKYYTQAGTIRDRLLQAKLDRNSPYVAHYSEFLPDYWETDTPFLVKLTGLVPIEEIEKQAKSKIRLDFPYIDMTNSDNNSAKRLLIESNDPELEEFGALASEEEALLYIYSKVKEHNHDLTTSGLIEINKYFSQKLQKEIQIEINGKKISLFDWTLAFMRMSEKEQMYNCGYAEINGDFYCIFPREIEMLISLIAGIDTKDTDINQIIPKQIKIINRLLEISRTKPVFLFAGLSVGSTIAEDIIAQYPIASKIILADPAKEHQSNRNRRYYPMNNQGKSKVEYTRSRLLENRPWIAVESHPEGITADNVLNLVDQSWLILDEIDNFYIKTVMREAAILTASKDNPKHFIMAMDLFNLTPIEYHLYDGSARQNDRFFSKVDNEYVYQAVNEAERDLTKIRQAIAHNRQPDYQTVLHIRQIFFDLVKKIVGDNVTSQEILNISALLENGEMAAIPQPATTVYRTAAAVTEVVGHIIENDPIPEFQVAEIKFGYWSN